MRLVSACFYDTHPFDQLEFIENAVVTEDPNILAPGDILVVWGGGDIHPSLYGHGISVKSGARRDRPGDRDIIEWNLMQRAKELGIPIIGVCRGAQMLCALEGGHLFQHVENHAGQRHLIKTIDGEELFVNSLHHQMMQPKGDYELIAWTKPLSNKYHVYFVDDTGGAEHVLPQGHVDKEPEFVYYPKIKGFAIQWHPEMEHGNTAGTRYLLKFIKSKLENVNV